MFLWVEARIHGLLGRFEEEIAICERVIRENKVWPEISFMFSYELIWCYA